jgi:glutamate carboxypeptidase
MTIKGKASHAGAAPEQGRNALIELAHQIGQTADIAQGIPGAQLNWTEASSGKVRNQIPDLAQASADVRLTAADAAQKLEAALKAKVAQRKVPDTETTVRLQVGRPPFAGDARTKSLALRAQAIYAELDGRALSLVPGTGGGTDAGYASRSGKPVVLESLGLAGWGYHARDEYIELDSIVPRLYLSTRMLMELGRE